MSTAMARRFDTVVQAVLAYCPRGNSTVKWKKTSVPQNLGWSLATGKPRDLKSIVELQ
jgi:hypothetical protein